jgi:HEAT repeat protein
MRTDAVKVIPILKSIALESTDEGEGRRALLVLAQSDRPEARDTVIDVAKSGPEPVRLVAVRELGRLKGPTIVEDLMEVYATGNENVRYQVVTSLAQPDAAPALYKIARSEKDRRVRDVAIVRLGDAGGRLELSKLYVKAPADIKRPIILGLFNAQADEELIQIAEMEKGPCGACRNPGAAAPAGHTESQGVPGRSPVIRNSLRIPKSRCDGRLAEVVDVADLRPSRQLASGSQSCVRIHVAHC